MEGEIIYTGEATHFTELGHTAVFIAFGAALLGAVAYFLHTSRRESELGNNFWLKIGRSLYGLHTLGLFLIVGLLFNMLLNHHYEYDYVWKHSNDAMPMRYILSCFWEGQEGSFLLWIFWNMILGWFIVWRGKRWEGPVLTVFLTIQVFLTSMLLGIYVFDFKLGSDPFILIRNLPENVIAPWSTMPDYLDRIPMLADGRGLNPLLQNYWMTIHPPTLFLGFSSTLVPFAYAIAGLWKREYKAWIKPALPWTFFSIMILGTGILMGGAWAYEALSFGGFWAWDPVENASLVPWLTMVAAAHVMIISKNRGNSLFTSALLVIITFILILYSTFLTRSGVLGETSVHSFTGDGMIGQLFWGMILLTFGSLILMIPDTRKRLIYLALTAFTAIFGVYSHFEGIPLGWAISSFVLISVIMLIAGYMTGWPKEDKEESLYSREFWLFIGSLVLLLSAFQITVGTSTPVGALLFDTDWSVTTEVDERIALFHRFQIPFAIIIALLIGTTQYYKYKENNMAKFGKSILVPFVLSVGITFLVGWAAGFALNDWYYHTLLFATCFAVIANASYWLGVLKGRLNHAGASIAHIGFGLVLIGALLSTGKSEIISSSMFNINNLIEGINQNESAVLIENQPVVMGPYYAEYRGYEEEGPNLMFEVAYYDTKPRDYKAGDIVFSGSGLYEAKVDHQTGEDFLSDSSQYWRPVQETVETMQSASPWSRDQGEYQFSLYPTLQRNETMGNVAEPSTRHYWDHDIYTHLEFVSSDVIDKPDGEFRAPAEHKVAVGDTAFLSDYIVKLEAHGILENMDSAGIDTSWAAIQLDLSVYDIDKNLIRVRPIFAIDDQGNVAPMPLEVEELGLQFEVKDLDMSSGTYTINIAEHRDKKEDFIVMKAISFPYINVLWIGCFVMIIGTLMAIFHRVRLNRKTKS